MNEIVKLQNVSKVYSSGSSEFYALDSINLTLEKGKFVVILGPSGAGKSTLLNLIGGLDNPTSGTIIVDGEDITNYNEDQLSDYRADNIGFIFQFYNILPSLTVLENVDIIRDVAKNPLSSEESLRAVGLEKHLDKNFRISFLAGNNSVFPLPARSRKTRNCFFVMNLPVPWIPPQERKS